MTSSSRGRRTRSGTASGATLLALRSVDMIPPTPSSRLTRNSSERFCVARKSSSWLNSTTSAGEPAVGESAAGHHTVISGRVRAGVGVVAGVATTSAAVGVAVGPVCCNGAGCGVCGAMAKAVSAASASSAKRIRVTAGIGVTPSLPVPGNYTGWRGDVQAGW